MNRFLIAIVLSSLALPAMAQVGVSVTLGEPGFYGRIDIGNALVPQLVYPQPVVIAPVPQYVGVAPIYLRVPPGYARHWRRYCARYNACGRPVYFVRDDWYLHTYIPYYYHAHPHWHDHDHDHGGHHGHHHHHDDDDDD